LKRLTTLFITLFLLAPAAFAQGQAPAPLAAERDQSRWKEYASAAGRFAVLAPGELKLDTQKLPTPDGAATTLFIHTLNTSADYGVIYADYTFPVRGAEMQRQLLDDGARGAVASVGSKLIEAKEVSLGEHPGRALKELMRDGRVMHVRMYLVGSRLYQVAVTLPLLEAGTPAAAFGEEVAAKFLDSFRLLEESAPAGEVDILLKALGEKGEKVYGVQAGSMKPEDADRWVISKPQPAYPAIAKAAHVQGTVVVEIVVDEEGKVMAAQAQSGHPLLQASAVSAARAARFKPALVEGKAVKLSGVVSYNFVLK